MANARDNDWDEEYSVIGDEGGVSFEDFQDDKSLFGFNPLCQGPVFISVPFPLCHGKPQSSLVGETAADPITIRNTTEDPVELWSVRIFSSNPKDCYMLSLMRPPQDNSDEEAKETFVGSTVLDDRVLQPGETLTVWLSCKPEEIGMHTAVIHFVVGDEKIERVAFLLVDDNISQALASSKPFTRTQRRKKFDFDQYIPASRPPRSAKQEFRYILPQFPIPRDVRELIESRQVPGVITDGLNDQNYSTFFNTLLFMEEIHLEEEMRGHDMELVSMRRKGNYLLALEVPGLAEKRHSLVYGDFIFVKPASDGLPDHIRPYQGYIYRVEANEVCLKFADEFHHLHQDGNLYNVSFAYNRVNMRRLYQAIQAAEGLGTELLFPSVLSKRRMIRTRKPVVPLNKNLNLEQLNCVKKILECRGAPPYVIHGPPGTGKTMTLVEAISQICRLEACARVLVCASSNSAADHVLEKLVGEEGAGVGDSKIFRLNATSRPYDDLKAEYIQFCFFQDMVFKCPPLKALLRYRIIVSTYMSASLLYAEGIRRGHFTHILLDEAGQASEPETMVPIANLCNRETVIVLAGDHLQLGPVIYSKEAESHGLGQSYLQRLFKYDIYKNEDENYVTKLVRNYRCHPAILELPSKLFYNGELIASKDENDFPIYKLVDITKNQFPVLFVGIQGCDEREGSNPSWFNRIEVSKVIELIRKLKWNMEFSESDIGVITPYRQQVLKLKKALESLEMADVKVGSVEQFQGQEREIIFISTVRSTVKHNEFDRDHNLGFLSNPRRFNVAITRARSLLVIVGNPHIITKDPFWDRLLRHCAENGSYHGCPLPEPEMHYYPDDTATTYVEANPNKIIWNDLPAEYTNEVAWDEELPNECRDEVEWDQIPMQCQKEVGSTALSRRCRNEGECNGTATTYVGANPDEIIWNDLPAEYTNEVSWDEELPNECRDEVEWDQIPTQFQEEVESTALARHSRNEGECNEPPLQHIKEGEWNEDHLMQYTDEGEWNEDLMIGHIDEADKNMPRQCADEVEWDEYIPEVCTDDFKRTKATPGQYTVEVGSSEYIPRQYSDEVEWNKGCIQHCKKDTERNKGNSKQYTRRTGKVDQHQQKQHFDQYEQNEDNQHCRDAGWSEGNDEEWNEQRSKQHSQRAEWKNSSAGGVMKSRNGTGSDKLSNKVQWDREKHKRYSNKTEWQQASSSGGGTKAITRETGRHGYDPNMFPNKFKREEQRPKESSHRHAWSKIPSSTGGQKRGKNEVEMLGQSFQNAKLN